MNSAGNEQLAEAAREALHAGEVATPTKLIALMAGLDHPLQALLDMYKSHDLFAAFDQDFGFIRFSFTNFALVPDAQIQVNRPRYAALLRWLISELRQWRRAEDLRFAKLVAAIVAAQVCDIGNALWALLPDDIADNTDLVGSLKALFASFDVTFTPQEGAAPPIWETEAVEAFRRADAGGDWTTIIRLWRQFPPNFANALETETMRFLHRYDRSNLVASLANLRKTTVAMRIAEVFAAEERLALAIASDNPRFQLASAYRTLVDGRGVTLQHLSDEDASRLTELLIKVADDDSRWSAWMMALVRYPAMQKPLGHALARVPTAALDGYVNSFSPLLPKSNNVEEGRRNITESMRVFHASAAPERRVALWTIAYKRWLAWAFNAADLNQHLTAINWSDLDYAIVGYALECLDEAARVEAIIALCREMERLEYRWHASHTDMLMVWYRLLSQLQPYAHASTVAKTGGDWLPQFGFSLPPVLLQDKYLAVMYNMEMYLRLAENVQPVAPRRGD
jgi:hypothetical protein